MIAALLMTVVITIDHNTGTAATRSFKFSRVPSPAKDDAAAQAKLAIVRGQIDHNSAGLTALTDGLLPSEEDEPKANFFLNAGTSWGSFRMDLGRIVKIAQINTYSWHPDSRAPQVYMVYGSDAVDPKPDCHDPTTCGWKLIATVDTRPPHSDGGGQYGVSITSSTGSLGAFRHLLFACFESESDDAWGNTFYSEVDVVEKK
jgi:hypothetical protein